MRFNSIFILGSVVRKHDIIPLLQVIENRGLSPRIMNILSTAEIGSVIQCVVTSDLLQQYKEWDTLPSGKNFPRRQCFLLDINSQQLILTHGIVGELCIAEGELNK